MDFNTVPWSTSDVIVSSFLLLATVVCNGFPIEYLFRGKWRTDSEARIILFSKITLAAALNFTVIFLVLYHAGHYPPLWLGVTISCSVYFAIAVAQGTMWLWLRRILNEKR